jgi:hypothetical protein
LNLPLAVSLSAAAISFSICFLFRLKVPALGVGNVLGDGFLDRRDIASNDANLAGLPNEARSQINRA